MMTKRTHLKMGTMEMVSSNQLVDSVVVVVAMEVVMGMVEVLVVMGVEAIMVTMVMAEAVTGMACLN